MFELLLQLMANGQKDRNHPNVYYPVAEEEVLDAESRLGFRLPEQLRTFYQEVGYGFFRSAGCGAASDACGDGFRIL